MLRKHPDVYLPPLKEVNYFGIRDKETTPFGLTFGEYLTYFLGAKKGQQIGEFSPAYLTQPDSLARIRKHLPNAKILITLRPPMARFISQFRHHATQHGYKKFNHYVRDALEQYRKGWPNGKNWYVPVKNIYQSLYFDGIDYLYSNFDKKQILVIKQPELRADYKTTMASICKFLSVPQINFQETKTNLSEEGDLDMNISEDLRARLREVFDVDLNKLEQTYHIKIDDYVNEIIVE